MSERLSIALAQINPTVGDLSGNVALIREIHQKANQAGADLVVFPELAVVGYPPEDLVLRPSVQEAAEAAVRLLAGETGNGAAGMLVPTIWRVEGQLYNAIVLLEGGKIAGTVLKYELPNYGVFDEERIFAQGPLPDPLEFRGVRLGVMICEDMWFPRVTAHLAKKNAEMLIVSNGSPFDIKKEKIRLQLAQERVTESGLPLVYLNFIGGQDELVFDGGTFVLNRDSSVALQLPHWQEQLEIIRFHRREDHWMCDPGEIAPPLSSLESIYTAMVLGLRDYVNKNHFPGVVLGLSGGVDSALSAAVAADALGVERVRCVMMPSRYTSRESLDDASECADLLGVQLDSVSIHPAVEAYDAMLHPLFTGRPPDITEENIQARVRGQVLMALSNKFGQMVLTTGNKSEMAVGYATLYGDMCGGYSVLKDVYKTTVFELCRWRNEHRPQGALGPAGRVIPERIITKPPTAELRENQKDQDSLPPYDQLDSILERLVEKEDSMQMLIDEGFPADLVRRVQHLLFLAEYKRRQSPPGVKITSRNFGRDRRYPITNAFRDQIPE